MREFSVVDEDVRDQIASLQLAMSELQEIMAELEPGTAAYNVLAQAREQIRQDAGFMWFVEQGGLDITGK